MCGERKRKIVTRYVCGEREEEEDEVCVWRERGRGR
jgi:hypothetical protein